jgi:hypothetical protein
MAAKLPMRMPLDESFGTHPGGNVHVTLMSAGGSQGLEGDFGVLAGLVVFATGQYAQRHEQEPQ